MAALLAVLAMGTYTPVYPACCAAAGQSMFTRTGTFTLYAGFALAWLAADGYDQAPGLARRWALGLAGTALLCGLAGALLPRAAWHAAAGWVVGQAVTKQVDDLGALAAGWQSVLSTQLLLAGGVLALAAGLAAVDRRWLPGLLAIELVLAGAGHPATNGRSSRLAPRPAEVPSDGLLWMAPAALETTAQRCFGFAQYPSPPLVEAARAALVGNVLVGTGPRNARATTRIRRLPAWPGWSGSQRCRRNELAAIPGGAGLSRHLVRRCVDPPSIGRPARVRGTVRRRRVAQTSRRSG